MKRKHQTKTNVKLRTTVQKQIMLQTVYKKAGYNNSHTWNGWIDDPGCTGLWRSSADDAVLACDITQAQLAELVKRTCHI